MDGAYLGFTSINFGGAMKIDERLELLEEAARKNEIKEGISAGIKLRCYAAWSIAATAMAGIGSWCSQHIDAIKAGFLAFWTVLWSK